MQTDCDPGDSAGAMTCEVLFCRSKGSLGGSTGGAIMVTVVTVDIGVATAAKAGGGAGGGAR